MAPAKQEFSHIDLLMPFAFRDLTNWSTIDFNQEVTQDSIEWYPLYLTDFVSYLEGEQSGSPDPCLDPYQVRQQRKGPGL